ncbi:M23 family metallopeptidase [Pseudalkalibacillus caeni]|uniref:M23 family metallopeptidase n=1 Tax=Exobacillus caeni TaxID=2574798 RepID=A0A5R9FAL9_9BACL|nr:M23 family metallopeptidase [Pseudalkalibacillus caeni]TLS39246.1 M23 family metallopeptidase [Pseudalkalibacillus caeni]
MGRGIEDYRKRISERKKQKRSSVSDWSGKKSLSSASKNNDREEDLSFYSFDDDNREKDHPLFNKQGFLLRAMVAACLFLVVGILFKNDNGMFDSAKGFVTHSMQEDFQFATVKNWYEDQFGEPLAIFPTNSNSEKEVAEDEGGNGPAYAVPASGKITENFTVNGKGIMLETGSDSAVEAIEDGIVMYTAEKEGLGKTVVIQHNDGKESWYGMLESIDVKLYDFVKPGDKVGKVSKSDDGTKGTFYFAIKQGEQFIDPVQVIEFD